jgi:NAD(P)-dependent dehydrogenase (short-subunit alcohol dehydrogenase family)
VIISDASVVLVVGISRGIGRGLAAEYLRRGWSVIGTVRSPGHGLAALAQGTAGSLRIEHLDVTRPEEVTALRERLTGIRLDVLIVSAGISDRGVPISRIGHAAFNEVMITNALAPMRIIESLQDLVTHAGSIVAMSSAQGSISNNERGDFEVYRASKSALNQLMRSYAAHHRGGTRALLLIAPGWTQTELGGPGARLTVMQSVVGVIDTIQANRAIGELRFLDYQNRTVPW